MTINRSKQWWLKMADIEEDFEIGAGLLAMSPIVSHEQDNALNGLEIAFGRFIQLMRRKKGFSLEILSKKSDIELEELVIIEENPHYKPDPRTIYQLANIFEVSNKKLLELVGLITLKDANLKNEAIRFAARSENVEKLNSNEKRALESFVTFLSEKKH